MGFNEYYVVPPSPAQVYSPPKKDLSWMGLPEFVDDTVTDYSRPTPSIDVSKNISEEIEAKWKSNNPSFFEQEGSSGNVVSKPMIRFVKETGCPSVSKVNTTENVRKPIVKYAEIFDHLNFDDKQDIWLDKGKTWTRVNHDHDNMTYPSTHKSMTPRVVLLKSGTKPISTLRPFSTARPTLNSAQPKMTSFVKPAYSKIKRPFARKSTAKNKDWVPTVRTKFPTVCSKVPTSKPRVIADKGNKGKAVKASAHWIWKPKQNSSGQGSNLNGVPGIPHDKTDNKGYWESGCSRHMTSNISYLSEYEPFNGGYVSFGHGRGKITGKGSIKTGKHEFENVYFVEELKFNLFSVSQICDNKNSVPFTDTECLVLGKDFNLVNHKHVLLRTPRQQNMYTIDLKNVVPYKNLTCLIAKVSVDESMLWHRRLGHLNFKTMNKLVRSNQVKGLPSKSFENDNSCVAYLKGKQHKASCKTKLVNFVSQPLHTLHIDLFGPTFVSSLNHKWYCLVVTDDFSRCDNGGEFRNREIDEFCSRKGIKREFSNARTPQQNGVAERRNRTLIEAARTMVLVIKYHNNTPHELFNKISPAIGFLRPFGCHVMILNTLDHLGKFDAKRDEGYFVGYSLNSKAFRVFNKRTKKVEENLHVDFLENRSIEKGTGPDWLFDIDTLTNSMNYEKESPLTFIALPNWFHEVQMETSNDSARKSDAIPVNVDPQNEQEGINGDKAVSERCKNTNPTTIEPELTSTVETKVPTISTPAPTGSLSVPPVTSSVPRIILRGGSSYPEPPSIGNVVSFENRLEDFFRDITNAVSLDEVEADLSNMIKAIRLFLAYASYMGFTVYQMDVKSAFLYETIDEEVYVMQPPGFQDPGFPDKVYKVEKAMYGLHQAPRAWYGYFWLNDIIFSSSNPKLCREFESLMHDKFQMSAMGELNFFLGLQVLQKKDGIFISQDNYVGDISIRSMIGSLMYLTTSRSDIMFVVCACARYQVTPKECHLHAVKRIFRFLKGHPKLGLWYPKESPFDLVAYSDSDYCGANQDRKSTTSGCQFLGRRLISWQCKKQTIVATSTTEVEYVAVASGCGQPAKATVAYADKGSDSTNDTANVLSTLGAANILASGGLRSVFTTASLSVATASTVVSPVVATASGSFPITVILTTTSVATLRVSRSSKGIVIESSPPISVNIPSISKEDKGKGIMTEPEQPSKEKVLEQMSAQLARELEAKFAQEDQIIREQAERDSEIARIHAERELEMMIAELDRSNEMVAKYLSEYEQAEAELSHDEKVELINELLEYQRNLAQIKKYQAQQSKLATKAERRKFYMSVLRSNAGWKVKDFKGMTFEQIEEKFIPVWEKIQDFVPMNSKLESERLKRPGIQLDKERVKKLKTTEVSGTKPSQEQQSEDPKELSEEESKSPIVEKKDSDDHDKIINLQQWAVLVREEVSVEVTPFTVKSPICDWKIFKDRLRDVYQIFRVGQAPKAYPYFFSMLKEFDREDVGALLNMEGMVIYMLDNVEYPLPKSTLQRMLDHKCEISEFNEELIHMINLIRGQIKKL
ncbi:putative ribonuclease H-like domain-containing protein [Tanacetum coccineum]